jgi:tripartite-type tricarboxylate transporter receptor subunit TctC
MKNKEKCHSVRPLATTGATRSITLPNVPTMIESGLAGFEVTNWYGVFAPTGTPKEIIEKLNPGRIASVG